jgi:hypothetical protein
MERDSKLYCKRDQKKVKRRRGQLFPCSLSPYFPCRGEEALYCRNLIYTIIEYILYFRVDDGKCAKTLLITRLIKILLYEEIILGIYIYYYFKEKFSYF